MGRLSEWMLALVLGMIGVVLLTPAHSSQAFTALRAYLSDDQLGTLLILGGSIRLIVLAFNGTWRPPMYVVRAWMALLSTFIWLLLTIPSVEAGIPGLWMTAFPIYAVFDSINFFRALSDAASAKRERLHEARQQGLGEITQS